MLAAWTLFTACGNEGSRPDSEDSHTITVTVQTASRTPAMDAVVSVWIVDADLPGVERAPIALGTAPTDSQGTARFTYASIAPPYVCGYEVKDPSATTVLAAQAPSVSNDLATPSGYLPITLP
ncbi:Ig-like domain-containing protein [bacterium]|nr:Ig-like domain-containing protein [bacterium]